MKKKMKNSAFIVMVISLLSFLFLLIMISASPQSLVTRGMISVTGFLRFLTKGSSYDDIVTDDDDYIALADLKGVKIAAIVEHLFS